MPIGRIGRKRHTYGIERIKRLRSRLDYKRRKALQITIPIKLTVQDILIRFSVIKSPELSCAPASEEYDDDFNVQRQSLISIQHF